MPAVLTFAIILTKERLIRLLENPELLSSISFEELKTLALAYPYAHNLRYLLAIKAQHESHPDATPMLATASVYSLDRVRLFSLMTATATSENGDHDAATTLNDHKKEEQDMVVPMEETKEQSMVEVTPEVHQNENGVVLPNVSDQKPAPATNGVHLSFPDWYLQFNLPVLMAKKPAATTFEASFTLPNAQVLAKESIREKPKLYSLTLAKLLAEQGHRDKAIAMLERMRLDFPEKSAYFAAEINKLKQ
ncbi:MAG: hypothetical protein ACOYNO_04280 [Saprospiraceae bacterium]